METHTLKLLMLTFMPEGVWTESAVLGTVDLSNLRSVTVVSESFHFAITPLTVDCGTSGREEISQTCCRHIRVTHSSELFRTTHLHTETHFSGND